MILFRIVVVATLILLTGCTGGNAITAPAVTTPSTTTQNAQEADTGAAPPAARNADIPSIINAVQPSVVTVFAGEGVGSGVIYSADGLILTNEHVVRGADRVRVGFADGKQSAGEVQAVDAVTDLALVRTDRDNLPVAAFETRLPRVGELAVVIGSPLGFENTATAGIISGLHRDIPGSSTNSQSLVDLIQTDAAISPGNSGGAVVNADGKVIGISEAYIPPQSGAVALGFAIPAATAVSVANQLRDTGRAEHAFIGIAPGAITPAIAEELGLAETEGAVVLSVVPGGPADEAGLIPGDVLEALAGNRLRTPEDLLAALREHRPGESVTLQVRRGDERRDIEVRLADRPDPN